jgi:type VI secretion system protein ImpG
VSDDLLTYYNRELSWFKRALAGFADAHRDTAANLRISEDAVEDPHTSRLIESVAFLNARIQSRLDDDFPLIVAALLEHLYPFYLAPKPSLMLAQMQAAEGLDSALRIPRGTLFETEPVAGVKCRFQNCYDVVLTPLEITEASLVSKPFSTPGADKAAGAQAVLSLSFHATDNGFSLADSEQDSLVLQIKPDQHAWALHDLLFKHCAGIVVAKSELDPEPVRLDPRKLTPMGRGPAERVLPEIDDTESQYQLLTEYFYYSDKFLYFRLSGLQAALAEHAGDFQVYIYLTDVHRELESQLSAQMFALHSSPMVNLFAAQAEPIRLNPEQVEYQLVPDIHAVGDTEVYAITDVRMTGEDSSATAEVLPYYGIHHDGNAHEWYWHGSRRSSEPGTGSAVTDYSLSITSLDSKAPTGERQSVLTRVLCSNGNLPSRLPYGGGQPKLTAEDAISGLEGVKSTSPPTPVRRLDLGKGLLWRLLSHLNLNYLSLVGSKNPAEQLREMLRLYDHGDSPALRARINALDSVKTRIISLPVAVDGRPVICRGVDIDIMFDGSLLESGSALLFGDVLMQFLSSYVNLNSFVRLSVRIKGREGIYHRWEPLIGKRPVI